MSTQNYYKGIKHVVRIATNEGTGCKHCDMFCGLENFEESINHYINDHGYRLLHVGQETSWDLEQKQWQSTVAVLGK